MNLESIIFIEKKINDITYEESVNFINSLDKTELNLAIDENKKNSSFIFALGIIYIKAKSIRCFPLYLAELIYNHIYEGNNGHQLFIKKLSQFFEESKKNVTRYMWGLCSKTNDSDIISFLKAKNSPQNILFNWLQISFRLNKPITKYLLHILERIQKKREDYCDIINLIVDKKPQLLFDSTNGILNDLIEKKSIYKLPLLFEINWEFTFGELEHIRNFLKKYPINTSFLINCSTEFSKNLIATIFNLGNYLDENHQLTEDALIIPINVGRIHEFVYYEDYELERIFKINQFIFDTLLIPDKYKINEVFIFFHDLFLSESNTHLFSRIVTALKTYGSKLSEENIQEIPDIIQKMDSFRKNECKVWLALMCIDRSDKIPILEDYILILKQLFIPRIFGNTISISPFSHSTAYEVIDNIRKSLPDFILNTQFLIVRWVIDENYFSKSLLPVLQLEEKSISIDNGIRSHINYLNLPHPFIAYERKVLLFPCKLQLLMLSRTKDELFSNLKDVLEHIGIEAEKLPSNDVTFMEMMEEMFFIMENIFKRLKISMDDFYNIYELLPKYQSNDISEVFINDPRFSYLLTNFLEERKVKQLELKCREYLATMPADSKITDAQSELGIILMNCSVCMVNNTSEFTDLLVPCGHTFCQSCSQKLLNCPNCRVKIDYRIPMKNFNIRIRKEADKKNTKRKKVE